MATQTLVTAIDGDGHIMENPKRLAELLEEPYREFRSTPMESSALVPLDGVDRNLGTRLFKGSARTTQEWLDALDRGPMAKSVLFPTLGLFSGFVKDPDYQAALCRAYNTWVASDICEPSGGRLLAVGLLPTHHEDAAEAELRRAKSLGLAGVMFPADGVHLLGHKRFDGVYGAAAELDFPVTVHASGSSNAPGADVFPKFIQAHSVAHPFGIMRHFTSMMFEGVFDKFPSVKFAFLETGATWVPWWMDRLDEEYESRGAVDAPLVKNVPSSYVHTGGNIFFGCESNERMLPQVMDVIGADTVMYASDYPHWDCEYPESLHKIQTREDLSDAQRRTLLHDTAARFYGIE
ncbi:MAG: amidohydrolase family protein [Chloroflexi bacterium]|nr:amidohydrolase family protein [Chloroflexota bacterium]MDA1173331.1 amidohydrolase family protein [Chloroflexota bacterium]